MKHTTLYLSISILLLLSLNSIFAQDPFDRNVTIEREYQPVIQDAGKITTLPESMQLDIKKEQVIYNEIYQPLPFQKEVVTLPLEEQKHKKPALQEGLLRIGGGNYFNSLFDFVYPLLKNDKNLLDVNLSHRGTFGKKQQSLSKLNLSYNHYFNNYDLYAGAGVSHQYFNYYGDDFYGNAGEIADLNDFASTLSFLSSLAPTYQEHNLVRFTRAAQTVTLDDLLQLPTYDNVWKYNGHIGLRSLPNAQGTKHDGVVNFDMFQSANGLQETNYNLQYGFSKTAGKNRLGIDFELSNLFYQESDTTKLNFWDYYAVFSINPYFQMERDKWNLRAGVKTDVSFIHGRPFNPTPDIAAEWHLIPKALSLYGGLTGSFKINTLSSIYTENPYVFSDLRLKDTYTPINPYAGFKFKPFYALLIDAFVDYRLIKDQYFFVNKEYHSDDAVTGDYADIYLNRFNAIYSDANLFRIGARINYNYKDIVNVHLKGTYNDWKVATEDYAWMKPAFEADFITDVKVTPKLTISSLVYYETNRYAKLGSMAIKMGPKLDINFAANYTINHNFAAFAKLNNVLNSKYQHYYGYDVQGLNFMIGGVLGF